MSTKFAGTIAGKIDGRKDPVDYGVDEATRSLPVNLRVWDVDLLQWVRMKQPATSEEIETSTRFRDVRYEYDSGGNLIYKGLNETMNAATSSTDWYVWKYEYDGNGNLVRKRLQVTSWDNRATGWS